MLIGLGEPFMDPQIFERIEFCHQHSISTLLSTNGTFLDERYRRAGSWTPRWSKSPQLRRRQEGDLRVLPQGREVRKSARQLRATSPALKHERGSKLQVVVQMVQMEGNAGEVDDFIRFWNAIPGVDQVRIKADETNLMRPDAGTPPQPNGNIPAITCGAGRCTSSRTATSIPAARATCWTASRWGNLASSRCRDLEFRRDAANAALHATGRGGEVDICSRCCTTIPHPRWSRAA